MADTEKTIGHRAWNMAQGTDQQWQSMNQHQRQAFEQVAAAAAAITRSECIKIASEAADEIESRILKLK